MLGDFSSLLDFVSPQFDQSRREDIWLDKVGLTPQETPFRVAFVNPGVMLKKYGACSNNGPVLVIVSTPLKHPYSWDLQPQSSVVRHCLRSNLQVYLIEWTPPTGIEQNFGLADYADRLILDCLDTVTSQTGQQQVFLAGHSLGGTLAALFSALHPQRVAGLILAGAPVHFGPDVGLLESMAATIPKTTWLTALLGNAPGSLLSLSGFASAPFIFGWERWLDWLNVVNGHWARQTLQWVERWSYNETPATGRLFKEIVEQLYRQDRFMRGTLRINGRAVNPRLVESPLLSIVDPRCLIVPPRSMLAFQQAVQSNDTTLLWYRGDTRVSAQQVGMLAGQEAHRQVWPEVVRWIYARSKQQHASGDEPVPKVTS